MADLPARPDLDQLRHQARELLRAAQRGNPEATARIRAVSDRIILSSAQLALAREYGFAGPSPRTPSPVAPESGTERIRSGARAST